MQLPLLRQSAAAALDANGALSSTCRHILSSGLHSDLAQEDIDILKKLIISRVCSIDAFELLVKIDRTASIEMLIRRYLGIGVDPDKKYGGYQFELENMLSDFVTTWGDTALCELFTHHDFDQFRFTDLRVQASIAEALNVEVSEVPKWIAAHCKQ